MKFFLLISIYFIFNANVLAQIGITKSHINKAYSEIKLTATYPESWSLKTYAIYQKGKDRKCIDVAIIEVRSLNVYGVAFNSSFLCYFNNGKLIWYMSTEYTSSMVSLFNEKNINPLIENAIRGALIEGTITENELCKTKSEIEEEKVAEQKRKEEQAHQQKLAAEKKILAEKAAAIEKSKYIEIEKLRNDYKYEQAVMVYNTLTNPDQYMNIKKLESDYAKERLKIIQNAINQDKIDSAIFYYNQIKLNSAKSMILVDVQISLNDKLKNSVVTLNKQEANNLILEHKNVFRNLTNGDHKLHLKSNGEIFIDSILIGKTKQVHRTFLGANNEFEIQQAGQYIFEVTVDSTDFSTVKIITGSNEAIFKHPKNGYYKSGFLKKGRFQSPVKTTYSEELNKNEYHIVQPTIIRKMIDGQVINEEIVDVFKYRGKFKRRALNVSVKLASILSCVSWGALRVYESILIN